MGDIVSESTGDFISVRLGDFIGIRNQAILQRSIGTFDAALRLRSVGTDNIDVELVQRPAKLGHAVTPGDRVPGRGVACGG